VTFKQQVLVTLLDRGLLALVMRYAQKLWIEEFLRHAVYLPNR
jgi:hypothetical protein